MGDGEKASLRLQFNPKVRLAFHGATITTDAGLLAFREFDDALGLTEIAEDYLQESRTGRNIHHHLVPLLRQSIYSRLAGYDDTNDAVRLSQDPAMRVIVGWQGSERKGASTSEMGRFETEFLTQEDNRQALARMNTRWVERAMAHTLHQRVILDMDSSDLGIRHTTEGTPLRRCSENRDSNRRRHSYVIPTPAGGGEESERLLKPRMRLLTTFGVTWPAYFRRPWCWWQPALGGPVKAGTQRRTLL